MKTKSDFWASIPAPTDGPRNMQLKAKSSTEMEVHWDAPAPAHWNSEMLSYKIGYK